MMIQCVCCLGLTWDYKDELEMGLNPSKRAMGTGSSDYLNFMTSASSDLFEPGEFGICLC